MDLLIEVLGGPYSGSYYLIQAISMLAREEHKAMILEALPHTMRLVEVVVERRWVEDAAETLIAELNEEGIWKDPIVTEVTPLEKFYKAEEYHQEYFRNNPGQPYCMAVVAPKVAKMRQKFGERVK